MDVSNDSHSSDPLASLNLNRLTLEQIKRIDVLLASLGDYGEVHLVVQHGELRYINKVESYKAWNGKDAKPPAR